MEIPHIRGDKHVSDWIADYMRVSEQDEYDKSVELRFQENVHDPAIRLLVEFTDPSALMVTQEHLKLFTPPVAYTLYSRGGKNLRVDDEEAIGCVWLEGCFTNDHDTQGIVVPEVSFSIWASGNNSSLPPAWIMRTDGTQIIRNTLSGEVTSCSHGDINRFGGFIWDIDRVIFGEDRKKLMKERETDLEHRRAR